MTLARFALLFRSTVSFIDRMASAYGDDGEFDHSPHDFRGERDAPRRYRVINGYCLCWLQQAIAGQKTLSARSIGQQRNQREALGRKNRSYLLAGPEPAVHYFP